MGPESKETRPARPEDPEECWGAVDESRWPPTLGGEAAAARTARLPGRWGQVSLGGGYWLQDDRETLTLTMPHIRSHLCGALCGYRCICSLHWGPLSPLCSRVEESTGGGGWGPPGRGTGGT